jgi:hypothetical protein
MGRINKTAQPSINRGFGCEKFRETEGQCAKYSSTQPLEPPESYRCRLQISHAKGKTSAMAAAGSDDVPIIQAENLTSNVKSVHYRYPSFSYA